MSSCWGKTLYPLIQRLIIWIFVNLHLTYVYCINCRLGITVDILLGLTHQWSYRVWFEALMVYNKWLKGREEGNYSSCLGFHFLVNFFYLVVMRNVQVLGLELGFEDVVGISEHWRCNSIYNVTLFWEILWWKLGIKLWNVWLCFLFLCNYLSMIAAMKLGHLKALKSFTSLTDFIYQIQPPIVTMNEHDQYKKLTQNLPICECKCTKNHVTKAISNWLRSYTNNNHLMFPWMGITNPKN